MINSALDYLNKLLALFFRENLTKSLHDDYLRGMCFYQVLNLDSRIVNPDQIITTDVEKWASSLSNIYLNITKPCLDIALFAKKLADSTGVMGPAIMLSWSLFAAIILRFISPPFGKFVAIEQGL